MLLKSWPLLLAALSLSACTGPKLNYCITGSPEVMGCARSEPIPYMQADNWRCVSPADQAKMLRDCKSGFGIPAVEYCIIYVDPSGPVAVCGSGSIQFPSDLRNYVCLSPRESERLLLWCKRKAD